MEITHAGPQDRIRGSKEQGARSKRGKTSDHPTQASAQQEKEGVKKCAAV